MTAFLLALNPVGPESIEVDGQDVTGQVAGVQIDAALGQPTVLTLHLHADGVVEGDGIVQVAAAPGGEDADVICRFLEQVDPALLERDAFESLGPDLMNTTAASLRVLARYARGER